MPQIPTLFVEKKEKITQYDITSLVDEAPPSFAGKSPCHTATEAEATQALAGFRDTPYVFIYISY